MCEICDLLAEQFGDDEGWDDEGAMMHGHEGDALLPEKYGSERWRHDVANCPEMWCALCAGEVFLAELSAAPACIYAICGGACVCTKDRDDDNPPDTVQIGRYRYLNTN